MTKIPESILSMPDAAAVVCMHDLVMRAVEDLHALCERDSGISQTAEFDAATAAFKRYENVMLALVADPKEVTRLTVLQCGDVVLKACAAAMPKTKGN
ncbi:MAG TPA: hypothetical protein VK540_15935 [Polyangiaceae bacterium]|nr:hypothetical protein [Polyangiaceae bacterium]